MILSVSNQVLILLASVYGGLLLGLIFDLFKFLRSIFRFGRIVTIIGDILFWVTGLVLTLSIVYKSSSGLVRFYQLLGFSLGMAVYIKLLSKPVQKLLSALTLCVKSFIYTLIRVIRGPIIVLTNILWKPYSRIKGRTGKLIDKLKQDAKKYRLILKNKK